METVAKNAFGTCIDPVPNCINFTNSVYFVAKELFKVSLQNVEQIYNTCKGS
jgi:hypothetical protein